MPINNFECEASHIFEKYLPSSEIKRGMTIPCIIADCGLPSQIIHLTPQQSEMAKGYEPTLVYISPDGEICMPASNNPSDMPSKILKKLKKEGYKETFLNTYREYEDFRKQYTQRRREENQLVDEIRKLDHTALKSEIHNQINSGFSYIDKEGNQCRVPPLSEMHPRLRRIAEICLDYVDRDTTKSPDEEYYIDARENDSSYEYRDRGERTRWI